MSIIVVKINRILPRTKIPILNVIEISATVSLERVTTELFTT